MPEEYVRTGASMNFVDLGEVDDRVEAPADVLLGEAEDDAVDVDILAAGELRMESRAELDEGGDAALRDDAPGVGLVDAGDDPDQRALAGAVPAQEAQGGAGGTARLTLVSASTRSGGRASPEKRWVSAVFRVV